MLEWLFGKKKEQPKPAEKQKKKKKTQAEQQTQDRWQYQFLIQFLNSPLWRVSILDFVDQHCLVFDNQQVNKFQYTKIHNQFKELVSTLFDGMMQEIGLDDEKLVVLLEKGFQSKQKKLFNQLLLCDDFLKFKQLMVKRNKSLEDEAIRAMNGQGRKETFIQSERNIVHKSIKDEQIRRKKLQQQQQETLRKVMQQSRLQAEESKSIQKLSQKASQQESKIKQLQRQRERERLQHQKQRQQQQRLKQIQAQRQRARVQQQNSKKQLQEIKRHAQQKKAQIMRKRTSKNTGDLPPLKNPVKKQADFQSKPNPIQQVPKQQHKQQPPKVVEQVKQQAKGESAQQRKKRLLEQRQKIRKKKQQQRKKMLEQEEQQNRKVNNIVLQDQGIHESQNNSQIEPQPEDKVSKEEIQRRKQLMRKIKNRIVQDF